MRRPRLRAVANHALFGALDGFGQDARRVLDAAVVEAERLGHHRVGTEHILLGLLGDEDDPVARALRAAGVSLAAARHKVVEAVGVTGSKPQAGEALPITTRARRAVEWATRISHQRRSDVVTSSDLLHGLLTVEGTAGQVLRGLGVDIDRLSVIADQDPTTATTAVANSRDEPTLRCASCGAHIGDGLRYEVVTAHALDGATREAAVFSCGQCGLVLGVGSA